MNKHDKNVGFSPVTRYAGTLARFLLLGVVMAVLALGQGGCTFEHPAGEKSGETIDPRLKGTWHLVEENREKIEMLISEVAGSVYRIIFRFDLGDERIELEFDAYHIDLDIPNVLQTKLVGPADIVEKNYRPYGIKVVAIKGDELHVDQILIPDGMELKSRQAVRTYVEGALRSGNYPRHSHLFRRAPTESTARSDDLQQALQSYRRAAEQGDADAQLKLGVMFEEGRGAAQNDSEAVRWYRRAAEQGHATAQSNLGVMYANGRGVARNEAEAVRWYRRAAEQGYTRAQSNLGFMYRTGRGVARNDAEAVSWYRRAAEQGHAGAQFSLGYMYEDGRGVGQDDAEALRWYRRAAEQNHFFALAKVVFVRQAEEREKKQAQADAVPSETEVLEAAEHEGGTEWGQRYRDAQPISEAEFLEQVPAVRIHVRASPFITQHVPIEDLLDLVAETVRGQGIEVDPKAPITLKVEMLWVTADWTTTQNGREISRSPLHSSSVTMHLFMTAPVYRNGEFYLTEFSPVGRAVYSVSTGEWNRAAIRREMRERLRTLIGEMRDETDRPTASLKMWRERAWSPKEDGVKYAAYQAALLKDPIRLDPTVAGMSDIRPPTIDFAGDARRFLRSSTTLERQWTSRLGRLGLREDPASRNEIRQVVVASQEPINRVGRLFGPLAMHFVAMSTTAALWEHGVAFEFNEKVVLMNVRHSVHSDVDVKMPRNADLGALARRVQDAFLTEKFEEQMSGLRSRR